MSETARELIDCINKGYSLDSLGTRDPDTELARRVEAVLALPMCRSTILEYNDGWDESLRLVWDILNGEKP